MKTNLFITSAGVGSRLRPITETIPKPLLPLAGITVIERLLYTIQSSVTIDNFAINLHHKPEIFEKWAEELDATLPQPIFFYEKELLGTGGALINAQDFFSQETCLVVNGDILTDIDWAALIQQHHDSKNMVTLAVRNHPHERRVGLDEQGQLLCIDPEMKTTGVSQWMGYACAALYEPEFLAYLPQGNSHVVPYWVHAAEKTQRVGSYDIGQSNWFDLGNADSYAEGIFHCLNGAQNFYAEPLRTPWDLKVNGYCVIENNVSIGSHVTLSNCILLPGTHIENSEHCENVIAGPGFRHRFTVPDIPKKSTKKLVGHGGSDRIYSRTNNGILLEYSAFETSIERQIELTNVLHKNNIFVPKIYCSTPSKKQLLLQDLGDTTFKDWSLSQNPVTMKNMLNNILDQLIAFQFTDTSALPFPQDKVFDHKVLRWESDYFLHRCVYRIFDSKDFCAPFLKELTTEFETIANEISSLPRALMHRDFQSENIMIHQDQAWFIDFQGAHQGTYFYDAASLIDDPYLFLPRSWRKVLENYYVSKVRKKNDLSERVCQRALVLCGAQRHMQALGAYGFLSTIKGKHNFLNYVTPALQLLHEETEILQEEFPLLKKCVDELIRINCE